MEKEIVKEYSNGEITIVWKPKKCIHSGVCVKMLPEVYKPDEKPWINADNATTDELKTQLDQCPSGALSYYMNNRKEKSTKAADTKVIVLPNGPLLVNGKLNITDQKGNAMEKEETVAFCRCGGSDNKPYCDGSHEKLNFKDE